MSCHCFALNLWKCLQAAKVPLNEYEFPTSKLANVQSQLEKLVEKNYYLHQSAKDAYRSYLLSYNSHQLKAIFNVHALDLAAVGKSFGFTRPPRVSATSNLALLRLCPLRMMQQYANLIAVWTSSARVQQRAEPAVVHCCRTFTL